MLTFQDKLNPHLDHSLLTFSTTSSETLRLLSLSPSLPLSLSILIIRNRRRPLSPRSSLNCVLSLHSPSFSSVVASRHSHRPRVLASFRYS